MKTKFYILFITLITTILFSCVKDDIFENDIVTSDIELVINEVASNMGDPIPDWIEIYNPSDKELDAKSGFGVYDKPDAIYKFASGTKIPANGFLVVVCDKNLATADPENYANFGISSGGESVFLVDTEGAVIDQVDVPALPIGASFARIPDGGDVFEIVNPTQGTANSNKPEPPVIEARQLVTGDINDNQRYQYDIIIKDASGIQSAKLWYQTSEETFYADMAPLGGGEFRYLFPLLSQGPLKYYIEVTNNKGLKSFFKPDDGDAFSLEVIDGLAIFKSVSLSSENPASFEDIIVTVDVYDKGGIDDVRLYYLVNDDIADNKTRVDLQYDNGVWTGTIPGQDNDSEIKYYLRAVDNSDLKSYFPVEVYDVDGNVISDFNHDIGSTWPSISVAPLEILNQLVMNEINASGDPFDFIELYNSTDASIDISGYKVYDSNGEVDGYTIPDNTVLSSKGFYLIETGSGSPQGTFGISSSGEDITLIDKSGNIVDQLLKANWPGTPLVANKDGAAKWVVPDHETKGTSNN